MDAQGAFSIAIVSPDISKMILYQLDPEDAQICMQVNYFLVFFLRNVKRFAQFGERFCYLTNIGKNHTNSGRFESLKRKSHLI
jgi:hypothetical protein